MRLNLPRSPHVVAVGLVIMTVAVFFRVHSAQFLNMDDDKTVSENPHVRAGLTLDGVRSAFSGGPYYDFPRAPEWLPLTVLSRMLDVELFGLDPRGHHLMNLLFHVLNVLLLYYLFSGTTGHVAASGLVAAFFAVHPVQVEPVSWVTSRKDLLGVFFGLLTLHAYSRPGRRAYSPSGPALLLFILACLSKPAMVILPCALVLMDLWPLGRIEVFLSKGNSVVQAILEKWPLWTVSLIMGWGTFEVQHYLVHESPPLMHIARAPLVYLFYLGKVFLPAHLNIYGPLLVGDLSSGMVVMGMAVLGAVSLFVFSQLRSHPYLAVGWFWYLAALLPVISLRKPADRYLYFPVIGLLVMLVWGARGLFSSTLFPFPGPRRLMARCLVGGGLVACMILSFHQVGYWHDNIALYERMIQLRPDSVEAHNNLGVALARAGFAQAAEAHYEEALRLNPAYGAAHLNWGVLLHSQERYDEAIEHYSEVLRLEPASGEAHFNLGLAASERGYHESAIPHYSEALRYRPSMIEPRQGLAGILAGRGLYEDARRYYLEILDLEPANTQALNGLGVLCAMLGEWGEAEELFRKVIRINPEDSTAAKNLSRIEKMKSPEHSSPREDSP